MLSIKALTMKSADYFLDLVALDYYLRGGEPPGKWWGGGAKILGLSGTVEAEHLRNLFRGFSPDGGTPLVKNAGVFEGEHRRQPGQDLTFSAPKSVSVAWSAGNAQQRKQIQDIQQEAAEATLQFFEDFLAFSRVGQGGKDLVRSKLVVAMFEHGTSRALDPQLHTHCLVLNLGIGPDGKTRTILSHPAYVHKKLLGAYYRAQLAYLLTTKLGFRCVRVKDGFEIVGIPREVMDAHSQRSKEIRAYMREKNWQGAAAAAAAALSTRRTKENTPPRGELFQRWHEVNRATGFNGRRFWKKHRKPRAVGNPVQLIERAVKNLARKQSHFSMDDVLYESLLEAPEHGVSPVGMLDLVRDQLADTQTFIPIQLPSGDRRFTTKKIVQEEQELLELAKGLQDRAQPAAKEGVVERTLARRPTIAPEQAEAVRHLTQGRSAIRSVVGMAGTGKTYMLKACLDVWRKQGYRVLGAAPTGQAAEVLQNETGIPSDTLTMLLGDYTIPGRARLRHHLRQLRRAAKGRRTYGLKRPKPVRVDRKTIVVVDEAGMVSRRHMLKLLRTVRRGGGTLVLIGDPRQLSAVEGGSPFQSLSSRFGHVTLKEIRRQEESWARDAVRHLAEGTPAEAMKIFATQGMVTVREDRSQALSSLVEDWTSIGVTRPEDAIVLVATNAESEAANQQCQEKRRRAGCLQNGTSLTITDEDPVTKRTYTNKVYSGDRVLFTRNNRRLDVSNGSRGTVIAISQFQQSIAVRLDTGRILRVPVKKYRHLRLGYALTTHRAQGATVQHAYILAGGAMQDLPISYVQGSRARLSTRFYTDRDHFNGLADDAADSTLVREMSRRPDLSLASDLLERTQVSEVIIEKHGRMDEGNETDPPNASGDRDVRGGAQTEWDRKRRAACPTGGSVSARNARRTTYASSIQTDQRELAAGVFPPAIAAGVETQQLVAMAVAEQQIVHTAVSQQLQHEEDLSIQKMDAAQAEAQKKAETEEMERQAARVESDSSSSWSPSSTGQPTSYLQYACTSSQYSISLSPLAPSSDYSHQLAQQNHQTYLQQFAGAAQTVAQQQTIYQTQQTR